MRFTTLVLMGASTFALTGCSFLGNVFGHDDYSRSNVPAPYTQGTYHGTQGVYQGEQNAYHGSQGVYQAGQGYNQNTQGTYITQGYNTQGGYLAPYQGVNHAPVAANPCCVHGNQLSKWNIEGGIGPAFMIGGKAVTGDQINDANPNSINNIDMSDAYNTGIRADLGASYALTPNRKVTGQVFAQHHESSGDLNWGTVNGQQLTGALSDYKAYGAEVGLRQYLQPKVLSHNFGVRPYVEGKVGGAYVEDIAVQNTQLDGTTFSANDLAFYEGGWVPTGAGLIGIETPIAERFTMGLETGVRYIGKQKSADRDLLPGGPISGSNNGSDSWTIPVTLRGRYRF